MVRRMHVARSTAERLNFEVAIRRYLAEVTPTKRPFTQAGKKSRALSPTHAGSKSPI